MSDIVKALRALGKYRCDCQQPGRGCPESPAWEAADEIERLRGKLARVRKACNVDHFIDPSIILAILDGDDE